MMSRRELLIDEVKKFPMLYNTQHENHKDTALRDRCWLEISQRIGENSEVLKREWKILRDSYRQVVKKKGKVNRHGIGKKWQFESRMAYLLPFMTARGSDSSRVTSGAVKTDDNDAMSDDDGADSQVLKPVESVEVDKPDYWETEQASSEVNALELFYSSVCESTKRLPLRLQNKIKRDVLEVVMRAEEEYERETHGDDKTNVFGNL